MLLYGQFSLLWHVLLPMLLTIVVLLVLYTIFKVTELVSLPTVSEILTPELVVQFYAPEEELISAVENRERDDSLLQDTARRLSVQRDSAEGREGIGAFLNKRKPAWIVK